MKTNKNKVRLTESQLHRVIKESVNKVLKESEYSDENEERLFCAVCGIANDIFGTYNDKIDNICQDACDYADYAYHQIVSYLQSNYEQY